MEVIEFRKISVNDTYDNKYNDGSSWSRIYEYPLVLNRVKNYYKDGGKIHNSSWGYTGIHVLFKNELDEFYKHTYHSDILKSDLRNTFIYDITKIPEKEEIEKYDILLNVSTLEEVDHDHLKVFNNLLMMLKKGGIFIATFDLNKNQQSKLFTYFTKPKRKVLQLSKFEKLFSKKIEINDEPLNGENSYLKNKYANDLNCGIMVVKK
mgnify:CR=1 FL=1